jgi:hypothetical protein
MTLLLWPVLAMTACGLAIFLLAGRVAPRVLASLGLLTVLIGFFALFLAFAPPGAHGGWAAAVVFFGSLAVFRLMSQFESPR